MSISSDFLSLQLAFNLYLYIYKSMTISAAGVLRDASVLRAVDTAAVPQFRVSPACSEWAREHSCSQWPANVGKSRQPWLKCRCKNPTILNWEKRRTLRKTLGELTQPNAPLENGLKNTDTLSYCLTRLLSETVPGDISQVMVAWCPANSINTPKYEEEEEDFA